MPPGSPRYIENLVVLRYPDTEYGQVIVMGSRRQHYKNSSKGEIAEFRKRSRVDPSMLHQVSQPTKMPPKKEIDVRLG